MGCSLVESFHVSQLIRSFQAERPRSQVNFPRWDLNLVLRVLSRPPFTWWMGLTPSSCWPKQSSSSCWRPRIVVATYMPSTPRQVTFIGSVAILEPCPEYLPKVRSTAEGKARYAPIIICSLWAATADPTELALCPVVALCAYDRFASRCSTKRGQFFLSFQGDGHPISKPQSQHGS